MVMSGPLPYSELYYYLISSSERNLSVCISACYPLLLSSTSHVVYLLLYLDALLLVEILRNCLEAFCLLLV